MFLLINVTLGAKFLPQVTATPSDSIIFEDDFESYDVGTFPSSGGWALWFDGQGPQYQVVVETTSVSGMKALKLWGMDWWAAVAARSFTVTERIGFEVMVKAENWGIPGKSGAGVAFSKKMSPTISWSWGNVEFYSDGYIKSSGQNLQPYTLNTWYKVKVAYDVSSNTHSVWINDVLKATSLPNEHPPEIEAFALGSTHAEQVCYFDDVKVFEFVPTTLETKISQNAEYRKQVYEDLSQLFSGDFWTEEAYDLLDDIAEDGRWAMENLVISKILWWWLPEPAKIVMDTGAILKDVTNAFGYLFKAEVIWGMTMAIIESGAPYGYKIYLTDRFSKMASYAQQEIDVSRKILDGQATRQDLVNVLDEELKILTKTYFEQGEIVPPLPTFIDEFKELAKRKMVSQVCKDFVENLCVAAKNFVETDADYVKYVKDPHTILFVVADSPVNVLVTAPNGLRVGYDSATESVVNEIEGATYSGPGTEPQVVAIPFPMPGVYIIDRFGTGAGTYTITIELMDPDGTMIDSETWIGIASSGKLERGSIQLFEDGSFVSQIFGVIPEVPLGTIMASAAMIIALVAYIAVPKLRRKRQYVKL